jgi:hypothetical protein
VIRGLLVSGMTQSGEEEVGVVGGGKGSVG